MAMKLMESIRYRGTTAGWQRGDVTHDLLSTRQQPIVIGVAPGPVREAGLETGWWIS